jgi:hypothetical protein
MDQALQLLVQLSDPAQDADSDACIDLARQTYELWLNGSITQKIWSGLAIEPQLISRGMRDRLMQAERSAQLALASLYLRMLASTACPVSELFDTFCFSLSWQALHSHCRDVGAGEQPPEAGTPSVDWTVLREALLVGVTACQLIGLEGRHEAAQTICDSCASILRLSLCSERKGKGSSAAAGPGRQAGERQCVQCESFVAMLRETMKISATFRMLAFMLLCMKTIQTVVDAQG